MTQHPTNPETQGRGVMLVDVEVLARVVPVDPNATMNGMIAHTDFALVKKALLLPEEYTIESIYLDALLQVWKITLYSDTIPVVKAEQELPIVQPVYRHEVDLETNVTTVSLAKIRIVESNNKPRNIYHPATNEERPHVTRQYIRQYIPITTSTINP